MRTSKFSSLISFIAWLLVLYLQTFTQINAAPVTLNPENVHWSNLKFEASVLFLSASAEVELRKVKPADVAPKLYTPANMDNPELKDADIWFMAMRSDNFGRKALVNLWFEPDLTALQSEQIDTGRKNIVRTYRFLGDGVYRRDQQPRKEEIELPPEQWSGISYEKYPHPRDINVPRLSESGAIFYAVSAANLKNPGDSFELTVFGKKHLSKIQLRLEDKIPIEVEYAEQSSNNKHNVSGTVEALRVLLTATPIGKNITENEFDFLGLKDDINIYVDPKTHIPLQISSKVYILGTVDIQLKSVNLQ